MKDGFDTLLAMVKPPPRSGGVITDDSILLIYPPDRELEFREYLLDKFVPQLEAEAVPFRLLDLSGFLFTGLDAETIGDLQEDEFDDYKWMKQGLAKRVEKALVGHLTELVEGLPGGAVIVYATVALYPLIRFAEVQRELRDLDSRIVVAFPGAERGGKLHFMNQPDGGNYLAVKITL
ncbi:MAG: hypothetical protein GY856_43480 [bacterium]|nr:hypothetical protein [bacterium]